MCDCDCVIGINARKRGLHKLNTYGCIREGNWLCEGQSNSGPMFHHLALHGRSGDIVEMCAFDMMSSADGHSNHIFSVFYSAAPKFEICWKPEHKIP